jgi:iron complex transport system ATP-binding protein
VNEGEAMDRSPRLEVDGVSAGYGARSVLEGVSVAVAAGEVVALVGPNGAGKTTLLRVASGALRPTRGTVRLDGRDLARIPAREAARTVAGVAQDDDPAFAFTAREVAAMGRYPRLGPWRAEGAEDRAAVDRALAVAGLEEVADRPLPSLSSGERRRAAVARCLAQEADVLLLDEPTAHVDVGREARVLAAFRAEAKERGRAVLVALHDLALAGLFADRVVLLVAGRVAAEGAPREVLTEERLGAAFGADLCVIAHPDGGSPVVVPRPGRAR